MRRSCESPQPAKINRLRWTYVQVMECDIIQARPEAHGRCLLVGTNIRMCRGGKPRRGGENLLVVSFETGPLPGCEPARLLNNKEVLKATTQRL